MLSTDAVSRSDNSSTTTTTRCHSLSFRPGPTCIIIVTIVQDNVYGVVTLTLYSISDEAPHDRRPLDQASRSAWSTDPSNFFLFLLSYLDSLICLLLHCLAWLFLFVLPVMANKLHHYIQHRHYFITTLLQSWYSLPVPRNSSGSSNAIVSFVCCPSVCPSVCLTV